MTNQESFKGNQGSAEEIKSAEKEMSPEQMKMSQVRELLMNEYGFDRANKALVGKRGSAVTMMVDETGARVTLDLGRLLRVRWVSKDPYKVEDHNLIADFENKSIGYASSSGFAIVVNESVNAEGFSGWTIGDQLGQFQLEGVPFDEALYGALRPEK